MSADARRLTTKTVALLNESDDVRVRHIRSDRWVAYPAANRVLDELEDLLTWPETIRPPCRLIVAETNNGKSSLIRKFLDRHPADENLDGDQVRVPVLAAEIATADEKGMYEVLLRKMYQPLKDRESTEQRKQHVISRLLRIRPKMLLLDESNDFIRGSALKMHACLVGLKHISNITKIPIVAVGTPEAKRVFTADKQLENRFDPIELPRWKLDRDFRGLLDGIEQTLPLRRASDLADRAIAKHIFDQAGPILGEISTLVGKAATRAIRTGTECITEKELLECGYIVKRKVA